MKPIVKRIGVAVIGLLAAGGAYLYFADRTTPSGQVPLATLDSTTFAELRTEFNRAQDKVRVVVLLAPT